MPSVGQSLLQRYGWVGLVVRSSVVLLALGGYWLAFMPAHQAFGNPAFLLGLVPCIAAGALLGPGAAFIVVTATILLDRASALALPRGPETSIAAMVIPILTKLVLGVGIGMIVDSRWHLRLANARLVREVEARKRSEESLERSENLHRALVDCLGEGVGVFDAADRFLFANRALSATLQASPAAVQGRPFSDFFRPQSREGTDGGDPPEPGDRAEQGPRCYDVVLDGDESRVLLVTETLLTRGSADNGLTLRVLRDLTERVQSERRQRELEREVQRSHALQSLAVLAGGVAHDFNNLLSGVVGNAEFAELKVPDSAPPQLRQSLSEIKAFASEAAQLSRQMLAYAGRRSLAVESLDVNEEIKEALRLLHATVESRSRLVLSLRPDVPKVSGDKYQVRQIITNLVLNALEAMEASRGTLTLETTVDELTQDRLEQMGRPVGLVVGDYVRISVSDTGRGIPAEIRERVFEPFFSTKSPGRGMGLAAALGIVRSHRAWLDISSEVGVGTKFSVYWPVAQRTGRTLSPAAAPSEGSVRRGCVLLIDDEPAVRIVTAKLLAELGQRVLVAESGQVGIELFRRHGATIDLVLLDLTMPEQSGAEVLGELRRIRDDVKVVVTSGYHLSDTSLQMPTPNVLGFLEKPHTLAKLEIILASLPPSGHTDPPAHDEPSQT